MTLYSGGPMAPVRTAPRRPVQHRQAPAPGTLYSGGPVARPKPARKAPHAKKAGHAKKAKRGLARSATSVACCAAEALAASLRLAGGTVADEDVLALYWHTADGPDTGASILATLEAASEHGLAGYFPAAYSAKPGPPTVRKAAGLTSTGYCPPLALILGAELPGPHALYDDGEAWWSWGEPYDPAAFPGAVIEEAWAVTWA